MIGDDPFEFHLELFKVTMQCYRESFWRSSVVRRDEGFFLCGQTLGFLHRLLPRIVTRGCLSEEDDWDALLDFDFRNIQLLSVSWFMAKTEIRTKTMRAAKGRINVERGKNKKVRTDIVASAVMGDMFNRIFIRGGPTFGMCAKNSSIILFSSLTWSWVWRVLITLFCLPCQGINL